MPCNLTADSTFHTKKLGSGLSSRQMHFLMENSHFVFVFLRLPFCVACTPVGGVQATYAVYLGLIGKPVLDFLLVILELFFARCYG